MEDYLRKELDSSSFMPFRIVTTTGKSYDITERDRALVMVHKRCVIIGSRLPDTDPYFNREEVVSILHVVRLEPIPLKLDDNE